MSDNLKLYNFRDLSGRRQRDVNNEERLKKYVAGAAEREREAREKREEKLEKLRRLAEGENKDKRGFSDPVYDKVLFLMNFDVFSGVSFEFGV